MAKIRLILIESAKNSSILDVQKEYEEKIKRFCDFQIHRLKSPSLPRDEKAKKIQLESKMILEKIKKEDELILLDEKGKDLSSLTFSQKIHELTSLNKTVYFLIGGAFGVHEDIKKRASRSISLSNLVMNHHVASIVFIEQLYRAFTIIKRIPYHNE